MPAKRERSSTEQMHMGKVRNTLLDRNLPTQAGSMTFATMLQESLRALPNRKDFSWLFAPICERKDQSTLTDTEKERFICAFNLINSDGTLGQFVQTHSQMHMQHTNARLLPWHRVFLYLFEEALHHYHPDVCIPYWNWTQQQEQSFPAWLVGVLPTVHTPTRTITVVRSPGSQAQLASTVASVPSALAMTDYTDFSSIINGIHGGVHIWVGGMMSDPATSPADPVFWLHHANLDRLWWTWYNSPQGNHQNPALVGPDAIMDPWTYTEPDTRDIATFDYTYV